MQNIFQFLENFFTKKETVYNNSEELDNQFQIIRFLSANQYSFYPAALANELSSHLPKWAIFYLLMYTIPKIQSKQYFYFPKIISKKEDNELKIIQRRFNCNSFHAKQILKLLVLQNKNLKELIGEMTHGHNPKNNKRKE